MFLAVRHMELIDLAADVKIAKVLRIHTKSWKLAFFLCFFFAIANENSININEY